MFLSLCTYIVLIIFAVFLTELFWGQFEYWTVAYVHAPFSIFVFVAAISHVISMKKHDDPFSTWGFFWKYMAILQVALPGFPAVVLRPTAVEVDCKSLFGKSMLYDGVYMRFPDSMVNISPIKGFINEGNMQCAEIKLLYQMRFWVLLTYFPSILLYVYLTFVNEEIAFRLIIQYLSQQYFKAGGVTFLFCVFVRYFSPSLTDSLLLTFVVFLIHLVSLILIWCYRGRLMFNDSNKWNLLSFVYVMLNTTYYVLKEFSEMGLTIYVSRLHLSEMVLGQNWYKAVYTWLYNRFQLDMAQYETKISTSTMLGFPSCFSLISAMGAGSFPFILMIARCLISVAILWYVLGKIRQNTLDRIAMQIAEKNEAKTSAMTFRRLLAGVKKLQKEFEGGVRNGSTPWLVRLANAHARCQIHHGQHPSRNCQNQDCLDYVLLWDRFNVDYELYKVKVAHMESIVYGREEQGDLQAVLSFKTQIMDVHVPEYEPIQ